MTPGRIFSLYWVKKNFLSNFFFWSLLMVRKLLHCWNFWLRKTYTILLTWYCLFHSFVSLVRDSLKSFLCRTLWIMCRVVGCSRNSVHASICVSLGRENLERLICCHTTKLSRVWKTLENFRFCTSFWRFIK